LGSGVQNYGGQSGDCYGPLLGANQGRQEIAENWGIFPYFQIQSIHRELGHISMRNSV